MLLLINRAHPNFYSNLIVITYVRIYILEIMWRLLFSFSSLINISLVLNAPNTFYRVKKSPKYIEKVRWNTINNKMLYCHSSQVIKYNFIIIIILLPNMMTKAVTQKNVIYILFWFEFTTIINSNEYLVSS